MNRINLNNIKPSELSSIKLAQYPALNVADEQLQWAVIVARHQNQWVFVKHKERNTLESPGGKREQGESITECAKRELVEETGAKLYLLEAMSSYAIELPSGQLSYGKLFFATIETLGRLPNSEIAQVICTNKVPENLTYPKVHPFLLDLVSKKLNAI